MIHDIVVALWFFLPAGLGNMAPIFAAHLPVLRHYNAPMDGGKYLRGVRLLGSNKTWRGLIAGVVVGAVVAVTQTVLLGYMPDVQEYLALPNLSLAMGLLIGALLGFGALAGDALKSFFKRQLRIAPGKSWVPFDQTDFIIGAAICTAPFVRLDTAVYLWALALLCLLHFLVSFLGWKVGMKKSPV